MARLTSIPPFTGTRDSITIFWMFGKPFMRSRSSLTGKRVKKDPAFHKTMQNAAVMAAASPIALKVYALMLPQHKNHKLRCKLTGEVMTWLKYGWKEEDIIEWLSKKYVPQYGGMQLLVEAPVTVLRPSYRRSKPVVGRTTKGQAKNTPAGKHFLELYACRRRDKQFRRELYKEHQQRSTQEPWQFDLAS